MKLQAKESGRHNADLHKSTARIIEGGSWRRQRVIMLIPAGEMIPTKVYLNHCSLIFPPNQPAYRLATEDLEVGEAFSTSIHAILDHPEFSKWEFLLTIEHDTLAPSNGIIALIKHMEAHPELSV